MSADNSPFSPRSMFSQFGATLEMMIGRRSIAATHAHDATGVWQAIAASLLVGILLMLFSPVIGGVAQFVGHVSTDFISTALAVLIFSEMLRGAGPEDRLFAFVVPFLWVHNVLKLLASIAQVLLFVTQQFLIFLLMLPILCWSMYWMWRVGRDQVGRGGRYAALLLFVFMTIGAVVQMLVLARLDLGVR